MPKTISEFLLELAKKAGVKTDEENFVNAINAPDFTRLTVPDEIITGIDNGLLSIESAKNNHPEIKNHYMAQAYNGLDAEINNVMTEMQITDDVKNVILNERSSTKRAILLTKKVKELEEKKKQTTTDTAKDSLQKTINDLNAQLAIEKQGAVDLKTHHEQELAQIRTQTKIESILNGYKTVYDTLDSDVKTNALNAILQKALQDNDAVLKVDEKGQLILQRKDGSNVFGDDNRQLNTQSFIDKILSQKKVLVQTDPTAGKNQQQGNNSQNGSSSSSTVVQNAVNGNDPNRKVDNATKALVDKSLKDLEEAEKGYT